MSNFLQKVIYLTQSDYDILASGGSVTHGTTTLQGLNPNYIYITDTTEIENINGLQEALSNVTLPHKLTFGAGGAYVFDGSADVTVPVYTGAMI